MASGPQRSGEIMETTLSSTLEPVPGPFACQGSPADGDDARQGPFLVFQKINDGGPTTVPISGPQGGTRLGSVCRFSVKGGGEKTEPIFA